VSAADIHRPAAVAAAAAAQSGNTSPEPWWTDGSQPPSAHEYDVTSASVGVVVVML